MTVLKLDPFKKEVNQYVFAIYASQFDVCFHLLGKRPATLKISRTHNQLYVPRMI